MLRSASLVSIALFVGAFTASAPAWSVTYTSAYTGNPFASLTDSTNIAGAYTTSMFVSGSFEVASPLAGGLVNQNIDALILGFSFNDGRTTLTDATPSIIFDFLVSTNAGGAITAWNIFLQTPQSSSSILNDYLIETCSNCGNASSSRDRGRIRQWQAASMPRFTDEAIGKSIGSWEMTSVPEPGTLALLGLGLAGLGLSRRRIAA